MTTPQRSEVSAVADTAENATPSVAGDAVQSAPPTAVPDVAAIARLANALYATPPASPYPGPGAALPSAHVFASEPAYNSVPGTPTLHPPLTPNQNPGRPALPIPESGAAQPSAHVFAAEPASRNPQQIQSAPALASGSPTGPGLDTLELPSFSRSPQNTPSTGAAAPARPTSGALAPSRPATNELDYAAVPLSLGGTLSLVPEFDDGDLSYGNDTLAGPAYGAASPGNSFAFLDRSTAAPFDPAPKSGNGATSAAKSASTPASGTPFAYAYSASPLDVSALDLNALGYQHQPAVAGSPQAISGVRPFDPRAIRRDFPILREQVNGKPLVWLDNGATTQKPQSVIDRLAYYYAHENSNIHRAAHTLAARSTDAYEDARAKVRTFINAPSPESIIFVRGTTEGINLIAKAWGGRNVGEGDEIIVSHLEHHANIVPWQQLAAEKGAILKVAPVDDSGQIILEEFEKLFTPRTRVASFSQVSNALGTVTPVADMVAIAHRHGAIAIVDGAQSVSHMPIDVQALDADFFAFSGHKMFAPTGIGAVYGRPSILEAMPPWQGGGNMISDVTFEKTTFHGAPARFEAGTGNIADAVGLGAAIDYLSRIGMSNIAAYEHEFLEYLTRGLLTVPGLRIIGTATEKAGVASFVLDGWRVEEVGKALAQEGIAVRAGHHCAQPILRRFGLEATVRPSLALYNTTDDVDALIAVLQRLQASRARR